MRRSLGIIHWEESGFALSKKIFQYRHMLSYNAIQGYALLLYFDYALDGYSRVNPTNLAQCPAEN